MRPRRAAAQATPSREPEGCFLEPAPRVLEKIVASGKLSVALSDKGLADRVVNLI